MSAATLQELTVRAPDGVDVPLEVYEPVHPRARVLMLPALGIQARLYRRLDGLQAREPRVPVFLAGHSLGGHLALMARSLHPDRVAGVVLLTTATPYYRCYHGMKRVQIRFLLSSVPLLTALLGYYPGDRLGFGGREARRLMADWLVMARENRYGASGMETEDLEQRVRSDRCPVLSIHCDRDDLAPLAAIEGVTRRLDRHRVDTFEITSEALGVRADHLSWARQPAVAAAAIGRWIAAHTDS